MTTDLMGYPKTILSKLVSFNTDSHTKENFEACASFLVEEGKKLGLESKVFNFNAPDGKKRPNVLLEKKVGAKETILLLVHYDVVPAGPNWNQDPFTLVEKKGKWYGRGAADDKAGIASCLAAIKEVQNPSCNIKLLITCDEEVGGEWGIQALFDHHKTELQADYCIVIDGKLDYLAIGCSGIVWGTITIKGKGGHAAYDFKTANIVHASLSFLNEVKQFSQIRYKEKSVLVAPENKVSKQMFGRFNITMLSAGTQPNVLPDQVTARFDLRLLPEEKPSKAIAALKKWIQKSAQKQSLKVEFKADTIEAGYSSIKSPYVKRVQEATHAVLGKKIPLAAEFGGIDGMRVAHEGIPTFNIGPGQQAIHSTNEHIAVKDVQKTINIIKKLITR